MIATRMRQAASVGVVADPPIFIAAAGNSATATSLTISKPTGTLEGHAMVASVGSRNQTPSSPDGWQAVKTASPGTGYFVTTYIKIAGGSEPANYTWLHPASAQIAGIIMTYSGVADNYPVNTSVIQATTNSSTNVTVPSLITTKPNCLVSLLWSVRSDAASWAIPGSPVTSRIASVLNRPAPAGGDEVQAVAGATTARTANSNTAQTQQIGAAIALAPTGQGVAPNKAATTSHTIDEISSTYDGVYLFDVDGDGIMDVVASDATTVYWYKPGVWPHYERRVVGTGNNDIEGVVAFAMDGVTYIAIVDSGAGVVRIYGPSGGDVFSTWTVTTLQGSRSGAQDIRAWDVDGDGEPELVYSWQGGTGGVHWLDFDDTDPMNAAHWTDYVMVTRARAWGLTPERADFGSGSAVDFAFTCRSGSSTQGVFTLAPTGTVTDLWTLATVENRVADWLRLDVGNFYGNGNNDIVACDLGGTYGPVVYDFANAWAAATVTPPNANDQYNVRTIPNSCGDRDGFLLALENSFFYICKYTSGAWGYTASGYATQGHPSDEVIWWHDINADGVQEAFIADSDTTDPKMIWYKFVC